MPGFWQVARRPRWIAVLLACVVVAVIFALLGQWQIARAVEQGQQDTRDTETAVPLDSVTAPSQPLTTEAAGRMVTVPVVSMSDYTVLAGRMQDGRRGWWVIARAEVADGADSGAPPSSLAVALGWSGSESRARTAASEASSAFASLLTAEKTLTGRYNPSEAPTDGNVQTGETEAMSVAALVNEWPNWNGRAYTAYLLFDPAASDMPVVGDEAIVSRPPEQNTQLNWLNVFYAIEWIAFMGFALYLWVRLVRDAREREIEAIEDAGAA